jgi:hypothetical protein
MKKQYRQHGRLNLPDKKATSCKLQAKHNAWGLQPAAACSYFPSEMLLIG